MLRLSLLTIGLTMLSLPALSTPVRLSDAQMDAVTAGTDFAVTNLVANKSGVAPNTDPNLVNSWGLATPPSGPLWVANNGTGTATMYRNGKPQSQVVNIPAPGGGMGAPTGVAFNSQSDFMISAAGKSGPSTFLFATEDGTIAGWNSSVNQSQAVLAVDQSSQGAVFKGLAITPVGSSDQLFAADFHNNRVDVFNNQFKQVGSFTDSTVPAGFAPFDVQAINGNLFVSFAKQNSEAHDDVAGPGNGFIDVFTTGGKLVHRLVSNGPLNSPWGMIIAPPNFGDFANALLVGNFGDGKINAFDPTSGRFLGTLTGTNGQPLFIDGLWSLHPSPSNALTLTFSSGPNAEKNGLLGQISPAPAQTAQSSAAGGVARNVSPANLVAVVQAAAAAARR